MTIRWRKRDLYMGGYEAYADRLRWRLDVRRLEGECPPVWLWTVWRCDTRGRLHRAASGDTRKLREAKAIAEASLGVLRGRGE